MRIKLLSVIFISCLSLSCNMKQDDDPGDNDDHHTPSDTLNNEGKPYQYYERPENRGESDDPMDVSRL